MLFHELSIFLLNWCTKKREEYWWDLERAYSCIASSNMLYSLHISKFSCSQMPAKSDYFGIVLGSRRFHVFARTFSLNWFAQFKYSIPSRFCYQRFCLRLYFHPSFTRCAWRSLPKRRAHRGSGPEPGPTFEWLRFRSLRHLLQPWLDPCPDPRRCALRINRVQINHRLHGLGLSRLVSHFLHLQRWLQSFQRKEASENRAGSRNVDYW